MKDIKDFLQTEIIYSQERAIEFPSPFYHGVKVGYQKAKKLNNKHIAFCQYLLNLIERNNGEDENV